MCDVNGTCLIELSIMYECKG